MPSIPAAEKCVERAKLADAVTRAVSDVYVRSCEYHNAVNRKESIVEFTMALQTARDVEHAVVRAYDDHIKKHGYRL